MPKSFLDWYYDPFEESARFEFETLDDAEQLAAEVVESERGSQWQLGDLVAAAVDTFGKYGTYKKLAGVVFYTTRRLKQFEEISRTFAPGIRYPDQPLQLYEVALKADDPVATLEEAVQEEWSPRELKDSLSQEKGEKVSRVKLFEGEAVVSALGGDWKIHVEAGRDWPDGNGVHTCHVTVRQIIQPSG
jgi:hypothetical protein